MHQLGPTIVYRKPQYKDVNMKTIKLLQHALILRLIIGGSRGGVRDARPPRASKFFRFHAVFGKIWRVHAPPGGFTPPPSGKSWIRHC